MILHKLTMQNFRQFRGTQSIEFASDADGKNITVVFGENGRGKTGIFRAIMFCLYGDIRLSQDDDVEEKELYLVNLAALREADSAAGMPVEAFVELSFSHKSERYVIKRSINGVLHGEKIIEEHGKVTLGRWKADGNFDPCGDPKEIKSIINKILDHRVKEYFLFDGEKIERLTKANSDQRAEIAKGIRNLLNVDALETAIKATEKLRKSLDHEITKKSTGELGQVINQLHAYETKRKELSEEIASLDNELRHALTERRGIDKKLAEFKEIRDDLEKRKKLENDLEGLAEATKKQLAQMRDRVGRAALLLVKDTIENVFKAIDERKKKGEIPSDIKKDLLERILTEQECICGREVLNGTEPFERIIQWKNRTADGSLQDSALDLWRYLSSIRDSSSDLANTVEELIQKYAVDKNEIERINQKIGEINKKIGSPERQDISELESHREYVESQLRKFEARRENGQKELERANQECEKLQAKRAILEQEKSIKDELFARAALTNKSYEALRTVYDEFTAEIKDLIGKTATEVFAKLLDEEGRETLRHIIVDKNYSLQILDRWGKPFLANISAGQRQIMSISFIAALAKTAANEEVLEMPLFMDTPFGRLSSSHRRNLIDEIPSSASQWVLLATDTELTKQEAKLLRDNGRWGKFYMLKPHGAGVTLIEEYDVNEVTMMLKDTLEEPSYEYVN